MSSILYELYTSSCSFLNGFWPATNIASKVREDAVWHLIQVCYLCERENTACWVLLPWRIFKQETETVGNDSGRKNQGVFLVRTHILKLGLIRRSGGMKMFSHICENKLRHKYFIKHTVHELLLIAWMRNPAHMTSLLMYCGDGGMDGRETDFIATV